MKTFSFDIDRSSSGFLADLGTDLCKTKKLFPCDSQSLYLWIPEIPRLGPTNTWAIYSYMPAFGGSVTLHAALRSMDFLCCPHAEDSIRRHRTVCIMGKKVWDWLAANRVT